MIHSLRVVPLCVGAILTLLVGCGRDEANSASAQPPVPAAKRDSATAADLVAALLTPQDVAKTVKSLDNLKVGGKESGDDPDPLGGWFFLKFISGDAMCEDVVKSHPEPTDAWAWVLMVRGEPGMVAEQIDAFGNDTVAQDLMSENRDQSADCRKFVAEGPDGTRYNFTYKAIRLPNTLGDESSGYKLDGTAVDDPSVNWDSHQVEIRRGSDVIFLSAAGADTNDAVTLQLANAALQKLATGSA